MNFDLEDVRDEPRNGPRVMDVFRAMRILRDPDVVWAMGIINEAMKADERPARVE